MANQDLETVANTLRRKPATAAAAAVASAMKFYFANHNVALSTYVQSNCGCAFSGTGLIGFVSNQSWTSGLTLCGVSSLVGGSAKPYKLEGTPRELRNENGALIALTNGNSGSYTGSFVIEDTVLRRGVKRDPSYADTNVTAAYYNGVAFIADNYSTFTVDAFELPTPGGASPVLKWTKQYSGGSSINKIVCTPAGRLYLLFDSYLLEIDPANGNILKQIGTHRAASSYTTRMFATAEALFITYMDSATLFFYVYDLDLTTWWTSNANVSPTSNYSHLCSDGKNAWSFSAYGSSNAPSPGGGYVYKLTKDGWEQVYSISFSNGGYAYANGIDYDPVTGMIHCMGAYVSFGFLAADPSAGSKSFGSYGSMSRTGTKGTPAKTATSIASAVSASTVGQKLSVQNLYGGVTVET
ncbi:hypothetical protein ACFQUU_08820 [Herbaspirillum sp. GCM10030257]|uniref:hypothetical protein n=1 Tax=Herbaspirillum sp. GCM10030257 TaxID=3273393 RepID=UPI00360C0123